MNERTAWAFVLSACALGCGGVRTPPVVAIAVDDRGPEPIARETVDAWADARAAFDAATSGGWDEARCGDVAARFERVGASDPRVTAEATAMIGLVRRACGDAHGADDAFRQALEGDPRLCAPHVALAQAADAAGHEDEARVELDRAVQSDARCVDAYVARARIEARHADSETDALVDVRRALAVDARSMPAFDQMARIYLAQARRARGASSTVRGGGVSSSSTIAATGDAARLLDLAGVVCRQGQLVDASYAPLYNTWALIDVERGEIVEALAMLQRAMQLDPSFFEAAMNFGELTLSFRGYDDAVDAFERASTLRPSSYDALVGLGAARRGRGDLDAAEDAYTRAIAIDATRPEAYFDLGLLYQDHRGGDAEAMRRAQGYYETFVSRADGDAALAPVVEAVTHRCPAMCGGTAPTHRRRAAACTMGRLQQITEALCILGAT